MKSIFTIVKLSLLFELLFSIFHPPCCCLVRVHAFYLWNASNKGSLSKARMSSTGLSASRITSIASVFLGGSFINICVSSLFTRLKDQLPIKYKVISMLGCCAGRFDEDRRWDLVVFHLDHHFIIHGQSGCFSHC